MNCINIALFYVIDYNELWKRGNKMIKRYKKNEIEDLVKILKNEGVISVPTDTVFGICARINSETAHDKLITVKNRPIKKSFPVMCANEEQIKNIAIVNDVAQKLIRLTSANQSGEPTCTSLDEIEKMCPKLDGMMEGNVIFSKGSTIIDCSVDEIKILREGPITIEQINEIVKCK